MGGACGVLSTEPALRARSASGSSLADTTILNAGPSLSGSPRKSDARGARVGARGREPSVR
jgi:hypothetical protein